LNESSDVQLQHKARSRKRVLASMRKKKSGPKIAHSDFAFGRRTCLGLAWQIPSRCWDVASPPQRTDAFVRPSHYANTACILSDRHTLRQTDILSDRQTDRPTKRQTDGRTDGRTHGRTDIRHTYMQVVTVLCTTAASRTSTRSRHALSPSPRRIPLRRSVDTARSDQSKTTTNELLEYKQQPTNQPTNNKQNITLHARSAFVQVGGRSCVCSGGRWAVGGG